MKPDSFKRQTSTNNKPSFILRKIHNAVDLTGFVHRVLAIDEMVWLAATTNCEALISSKA